MDIRAAQLIPRYSPQPLARVLGEARRYPLIPLFVLVVFLIIPAVFADILAPYLPFDINPRDRLTPPAWSGPQMVNGVEIS